VIGEPRLTHIALPVNDLSASVEWYERYTPLRVIDSQCGPGIETALMSHPEADEHPFVVVLLRADADDSGAAGSQLCGRGHLGIELPTRHAVDAMAVLARADGCLAAEPVQMPPPIGYVCTLLDPDGNAVEFSYGQEYYTAVREGLSAESRRTTTD
jgi:lactoylglutathione lyase